MGIQECFRVFHGVSRTFERFSAGFMGFRKLHGGSRGGLRDVPGCFRGVTWRFRRPQEHSMDVSGSFMGVA